MFSPAILILQLAVILLAARLVGWLFQKIHQPQVVGEMFAGVLLGPSFLGWVVPGAMATIFPQESLGILSALGQIGILIYMFLIGLRLDTKVLRREGRTAVVTSHVSIVIPLLLSALLALYLYPRLSDDSVTFTVFALFLGAAMSVTAFPVLARILNERNMLHTGVGTVTITCAAVDDVTAWCLLVGIIIFMRGDRGTLLWLTLAWTLLYISLMLFVGRRLLRRLEVRYHRQRQLTQSILTLILLIVLVSSFVTEQLGIHTIFGAFLAGIIMPRNENFARDVSEKLVVGQFEVGCHLIHTWLEPGERTAELTPQPFQRFPTKAVETAQAATGQTADHLAEARCE
jgi:Kef-type K+ transport system membrane component KefB